MNVLTAIRVLAEETLAATVNETATAAAAEDLGGFMSPERLELAGQVVLIGMCMVFAVLALLWGILALFGRVMSSGKAKKEETSEPAAESAVTPAPAEVSEEVSATKPEGENDEELVAALTAAVAAAIASDEKLSSHFASGFRVVSFKKTGR